MAVRVTQDVAEVLRDATPNLRVTQDIVEVVRNATPNLRVTQDVVEVVRNATPNLRVTQVVVEVLRSVNTNVGALTSNVSVAQSVTVKGNRTVPVTSNVTVTPTVSLANIRQVSVTSSATVAQAVVARPDKVRISVTQPVTVTPSATTRGDREIHVVQGVSVSDTATGRNNNVRIGITQSIGATDVGAERVPTVHEALVEPVSVAQSAAVTSTRQAIVQGVSVSQSVAIRGDRHLFIVQPIRAVLPDSVAAHAYINPVSLSLIDRVAVDSAVFVDPPFRHITIEDKARIDTFVRSNPQTVLEPIHSDISVAQEVDLSGVRRISVTSPVSVLQRLGGNVFELALADTVSVVTDAVPRTPRVEVDVSESVHVAVTMVPRIVPVQRITSAIVVSQNPHPTDLNYAVGNSVVVSQAVVPRNDHQRLVQPIAVSQAPFLPPRHLVHVSQSVSFTYSRTLVDTLSLTDSVDRDATLHRTLGDSLSTSDALARTVTWNRSLADSMPFQEPTHLKPVDFLDHPVPVPVLQYHLIGSHVANYTLFQCPKGAIVLPAPLLGDTLDNVATVEVKRSMSGKALFFKQSSNRQSLHMSFRLDHVKALELRSFLIACLSEVVNLITWDGRQYVGYFTNNPFELSNDGRADPALEFSTVDIEFEGTRL